MDDGFASRWSRRKAAARVGRPLPDETSDATPGASPNAVPGTRLEANGTATPLPQAAPHANAPDAGPSAEARREDASAAAVAPSGSRSIDPPPPTMADVHALTPASDFARFVASNVAPEVRNAALKKLFADPHFSVMDGLDVYVGDYTKPTPLAEHEVRRMASASFLRLFDTPVQEDTVAAPASAVPQSHTAPQQSAAPSSDAHTDLQLQPDDAAPGGQPRPDPG